MGKFSLSLFNFLFILTLADAAFSQSSKIDSLKATLSSRRDSIQINSLVNLSYEFLEVPRPDSAISYALKAVQLAEELQLTKPLMRTHFVLARALQESGSYRSAMKHFIECISLAQKSGDYHQLGGIYLYLGRTYRLRAESTGSIEDIPDALINYRRAIAYARLEGDKEFEPGLLLEIGFAFRHKLTITNSTSDRDSTKYYFTRALEDYRSAGDLESEIGMLLNLSNFYEVTKDYKEAERRLLEVVSLSEQNELFYLLPAAYANLGSLNYLMGNVDKSIRYREASLDAGKKYEGPFSDPTTTYHDLAFLYLETSNPPKAIKYFDLSLKSGHSAQDLATAYAGLSEAYYRLGDFKKAVDFERKNSQLKDSIAKETTSAEIVRLGQEYEQSRQTDRIELLEREADVNKLVIQRTKTIQYLIGGILVMAILGIVVLANQYLIIQRAKKNQERIFKEVDEMKSHFFANISHEFRTPLTLLLGPLNKRIASATDASDKNELSIMHRNANRLLTLVNQLLDLSKLESGSLKLQCRKINLNELISNISSQFSSMAGSRQIAFHIEALEILEIFADAEKLEKVVINLLSNAFKFTSDQGSITLTIRKGNADKKFSNGTADIIVKDTGVGIKSTELPKIFDRFYQVDNTSTRQHEGTGIGLALVKELVELSRNRYRGKYTSRRFRLYSTSSSGQSTSSRRRHRCSRCTFRGNGIAGTSNRPCCRSGI